MYFSLTPEERNYFLNQVDIILNIDETASNISKVSYFTIKVKQSTLFEENILEGRLIKYDNFLVIQEFKPTQYCQLLHHVGLFEVLCYESIKKLKEFALLYSQKKLRIFSTNSVIINQLFEHKAKLEKINATNVTEVLAKLEL
ncbi:MAG: hypothetical protein M0P43_10085 [Arcobacteraceae bacterium]|nr:hypothetical protein [Arcobacteraceae bacterium]